MKFTKEDRQRIVKDFALRNGGVFHARKFAEEVKQSGPGHEAYGWFESDTDKAAFEYWVIQARDFSAGLKVKFEIEEIKRGKVTVKYSETPLILSPLESREDGGGYIVYSEESKQDYLAELRHQAAADLKSWRNRYVAALEAAGLVGRVESLILALGDRTKEEAA